MKVICTPDTHHKHIEMDTKQLSYTIYAITKIIEETQVEASSKEEALNKVLRSPGDYDWHECGELEVEYEAN